MENIQRVALYCALLVLVGRQSAVAAVTVTPVAVLPLDFSGEFVSADRSVLAQRLVLGLKATQLRVISGDAVVRAMGQRRGMSCDEGCRRELAATLEVRYLVGGEVEGKHDNYRLNLWAADGYSGKTLAEVDRACDICGVTELASTMELAASALHAKLKSMGDGAAVVEVTTEPPGALIGVDGDVVGRAPRVLELPPGEHVISVSARGFEPQRRRVQAVAGVRETVAFSLQHEANQSWRRPVGWGLVGAGVVGVVVGGVLFGIDGQETDCTPGELRLSVCRGLRRTAAAGWATAGLGLAAVGAGVYFIVTGKSVDQSEVAVLPEGAGVSVRGRF